MTLNVGKEGLSRYTDLGSENDIYAWIIPRVAGKVSVIGYFRKCQRSPIVNFV